MVFVYLINPEQHCCSLAEGSSRSPWEYSSSAWRERELLSRAFSTGRTGMPVCFLDIPYRQLSCLPPPQSLQHLTLQQQWGHQCTAKPLLSPASSGSSAPEGQRSSAGTKRHLPSPSCSRGDGRRAVVRQCFSSLQLLLAALPAPRDRRGAHSWSPARAGGGECRG